MYGRGVVPLTAGAPHLREAPRAQAPPQVPPQVPLWLGAVPAQTQAAAIAAVTAEAADAADQAEAAWLQARAGRLLDQGGVQLSWAQRA